MNICIDIDGTMTTRDYYIPYFNDFFKKDIVFEEVRDYDLKKVYEISELDIKRFYDSVGNKMHSSATIQPHASATILKWSRQHKVYIVTARLKENEFITLEWLKKHDLEEISLHSLGSPEKLEFSKSIGCDVFIEDHPQESVRIAETGIKVLLMDNPYNADVSHRNITRVKNWYEIDNLVQDFEHKKI